MTRLACLLALNALLSVAIAWRWIELSDAWQRHVHVLQVRAHVGAP
jgi:hypothetical protein